MAKRLAITIAGAVSLGSYEAGVLYEVLDAIHQHNLDPVTQEDERIEIDVLTGASAGGMTATILAQKLLFNADQFEGPYNNPVYNTWVLGIDLKELLKTQPDERALLSLLSSDRIEAIAEQTLLSRYEAAAPPAPIPHAAVADKVYLGLALTNLNGVDYGYPVEPGGRFIYRDYVDQLTRIVNADADRLDFWVPLRHAAAACGAFPVAFRPQDLGRSAEEEPNDYPPEQRLPWSQDPTTFTYSDGGILQNQPLGMAKNLVDLFDEHADQESRFYLFVSPNAKDEAVNPPFAAANAEYFKLVSRLVKVVMGQAGFHDWITAEGVNRQIDLLDTRATGLKKALLAGEMPAGPLKITADSLLTMFFPDGQQKPPGARHPEQLTDARTRIAQQYADEMRELGGDSPLAEAFRDGILALESAAGLGARDRMRIYGITATDAELAGAGLQAFVGFFDQTYRDHDYDVGRSHARIVLTDAALSKSGEIGPVRFDPNVNPIRPIDAALNGLKMKDVYPQDLDAFRKGMKARVNQMIKELIPGWLGSEAVKLVIDPILDAALNRLIEAG